MSSTAETTPAPTEAENANPDDVAATAERCTVCEHDLEAHDAVSRRYCQATQSRALSRACVCRSYA